MILRLFRPVLDLCPRAGLALGGLLLLGAAGLAAAELAEGDAQRRTTRLGPGSDAVQGQAHAAALAKAFVRLEARRPEVVAGLDRDGDGAWNASELATLYREWAPTMVGHADRDGSGSVDRAEWQRLAGMPASVTSTSTHSIGGAMGTPAYLAVGNEQAYVGDDDVEGDQYDPQVQRLRTGTVHDVEVIDVGD